MKGAEKEKCEEEESERTFRSEREMKRGQSCAETLTRRFSAAWSHFKQSKTKYDFSRNHTARFSHLPSMCTIYICSNTFSQAIFFQSPSQLFKLIQFPPGSHSLKY